MSTELVIQDGDLTPSTLFGTDNPAEVVERVSVVARTLAEVVRKQNLVVKIGNGEHVRVEGWTFLGSLLGVFPVVEWTRPVMEGDVRGGWEARVEARTRSGEVVGAAEAECLRSEKEWGPNPTKGKARDDYALRSMAQTRAVSKALRLPLGFVMQLAGFSPTPAEEMPRPHADVETPAEVDDGLFPPNPAAELALLETRALTLAEEWEAVTPEAKTAKFVEWVDAVRASPTFADDLLGAITTFETLLAEKRSAFQIPASARKAKAG